MRSCRLAAISPRKDDEMGFEGRSNMSPRKENDVAELDKIISETEREKSAEIDADTGRADADVQHLAPDDPVEKPADVRQTGTDVLALAGDETSTLPRENAELPALPDGFVAGSRGILRSPDAYQVKDGDLIWLCSPIQVLGLIRDVSGCGWGRLIEVIDPDGRKHRRVFAESELAGSPGKLRRQLADLGLRIASGNDASKALAKLLNSWWPEMRYTSTKGLGWTDDKCGAFVLGDGRVLGADDVILQNDAAAAMASEVRSSGALEDWKARVGALCEGNSILIGAVSLAFAGPLLQLLEVDGGGLHLRGASSRGKSTAQKVAVSVWGRPSLLRSWRATANGLEATAASCNATMLALDELGEVAPNDLNEAVYMLANGTAKMRANSAGGAKSSPGWRTMILSSGEISVAAKLADGGKSAKAGQNVRLLDICADARRFGAFDDLHAAQSPAEFADRLTAAAAECHGTAGPAFVEELLRDREQAIVFSTRAMTAFNDGARDRLDIPADGQVERGLKRLALIAAAGELATHFGLTGWPEGAAHEAALDLLHSWIEGSDHAAQSEVRKSVERTVRFLKGHADTHFAWYKPEDKARYKPEDEASEALDIAGWRDRDTFLFRAEAWKEAHDGHDATEAARHLKDAGYLIAGDGNNIRRKAPRLIPGRPRVYTVRASILEAADTDGCAERHTDGESQADLR
ncbi:hypothetical protein C2I36_00430 [Rhodobacteraceae bacterium WD3A24]|nr:hypothetical protein C2I36_00430 [Rhodobacteraceae bacterium WD3A24]